MGRMTRYEIAGKNQIIDILGKEGYKTYAQLFSLFDLHLTADPEVVGYMIPDQAVIVINQNLDEDQVSVVVRHEILHEFFEHAKRAEKMGVKVGGPDHQKLNIAGDLDISNKGYTDRDKHNIRSIKLGGDRVVSGLVTEDFNPDLVNKSFEEIYDILKKESPESTVDPKSQDPQIGDRGNSQVQEAEDIERRAQIAKEKAEDQQGQSAQAGQQGSNQEQGSEDSKGESGESAGAEGSPTEEGSRGSEHKKGNRYDDEEYQKMSPEEKKKERARRRREAAKKLGEAADRITKEINDLLDNKDKNKVFDTPEEQQEIDERVKKIKELLENIEEAQQAMDESNVAILKEKAEKEARDVNRYKNDPLVKFRESLNKFIKDEIGYGERDEWAKINKTYLYSGILKPGTALSKAPVPLLNVYFDRSGSWDSRKTQKGQQAIATLNKYVRYGQLKIKLYYFSEGVHSVEADAIAEGGTYGQPILDHIQQTKPNNVVIMTDSDISDCHSDITIPGGLWLLFMGGRSENLIDHLHGKKLNKIFDLERY